MEPDAIGGGQTLVRSSSQLIVAVAEMYAALGTTVKLLLLA
jgi:hypothetical protein